MGMLLLLPLIGLTAWRADEKGGGSDRKRASVADVGPRRRAAAVRTATQRRVSEAAARRSCRSPARRHEDRTMTESQQSQRGWLKAWRERAPPSAWGARARPLRRRATASTAADTAAGAPTMTAAPAMWFGGGGFGGDGGGGGGDGGGGGC